MIFFVVSLLVTPFISLFYQYINSLDKIDISGISSLDFVYNILVNSVIWFFCGVSLYFYSFTYKNILSLSVMFLLLLLFSQNLGGDYIVDYYNLRLKLNDISVTHLDFGDIFVILSFIFISISYGVYRYIIVLFSLIILFMIGGRSGFIIFIISLLISFFIININYKKFLLMGFLFFTSTIVFLSYDFSATRMLNFDLKNDESFLARKQFFSEGLSDLGNQFLFGNPSLIVSRYGYISEYIHNLFSYWQFYGFLFFFIIILWLLMVFKSIFFDFNNMSSSKLLFLKMMFVFTLFSIILTKSATFFPIWILFGFFYSSVGSFKLGRETRFE